VSTSEQVISDLICSQPKEKSCSSCGVSFTCGPAAGKSNCWCEGLPHVSLVAGADQDCLCPECLTRAIAKLSEANAQMSSSTAGILRTAPTLVEGEDYYCEGAAIVFTAHYLRRRGYCCESGCRHCPYETGHVDNRATSTPQ